MANRHGDFIWYELLTTDADAAARFYEAVIGWNARAFEGSDIGYRLFSIGGTDVAGFMPIPADAKDMRPGWLGYVGVDDVDKIAAEIVQVGGTQHMPPADIPGVGRFAMVADPQGVPFYVMRGATEGTSASFSPKQTGHCQWNELSTTDQKRRSPSTRPASAGIRAMPCRWARWAIISSSPITARRSAP